MSNYITTHNAEGKAVFSSKVPQEQKKIAMHPGQKDLEKDGYLQVVYSNHTFKPNLSTEADIDKYEQDRLKPDFPQGHICPPGGAATAIVAMGPDAVSPMHRTMTLDTIIILEGDVELYLDSGESRTLHTGDIVIQRGTMHQWKNVTPNGGILRMAAIAQAIVTPIEVGGKKLDTEWNF